MGAHDTTARPYPCTSPTYIAVVPPECMFQVLLLLLLLPCAHLGNGNGYPLLILRGCHRHGSGALVHLRSHGLEDLLLWGHGGRRTRQGLAASGAKFVVWICTVSTCVTLLNLRTLRALPCVCLSAWPLHDADSAAMLLNFDSRGSPCVVPKVVPPPVFGDRTVRIEGRRFG